MTDIATAGSGEQKIVEHKEVILPTTISEDGQSHRYYNPYHLRAKQIYELREKRVLPKLPYISEEEIEDRSKSYSFVKMIAVFQIVWAATQTIVRSARKIAISQLELAVIAFAACAVVIYLLYWSKPKSTSTTITILRYQDQIPKDVLNFLDEHSMGRFGLAFFFSDGQISRSGSRIRNDAVVDEGNEDIYWLSALILGAVLFGGIHVGAWNFKFPSTIELLFWRCASVYSAAFCPGIIIISFAESCLNDKILENLF